MEPTKTCSKCGEVKGPDGFRYGNRKCRACCNALNQARMRVDSAARTRKKENNARWSAVNAERARELKRRYEDRHATTLKAKRASRHAANPKRTLQYIEHLSDGYVAAVARLRIAEATPELLALKREQLAIKRMARELKKAATKPTGETK